MLSIKVSHYLTTNIPPAPYPPALTVVPHVVRASVRNSFPRPPGTHSSRVLYHDSPSDSRPLKGKGYFTVNNEKTQNGQISITGLALPSSSARIFHNLSAHPYFPPGRVARSCRANISFHSCFGYAFHSGNSTQALSISALIRLIIINKLSITTKTI